MRNSRWVLAAVALSMAGLAGAQQGPAARAGADAATFAFKYVLNQPMNYGMSVGLETLMVMGMGEQVMTNRVDIGMRWKIKLTPVEQKGDVTALKIEPSGVEADWDMALPQGRMVMKMRGNQFTATMNGEEVINTEKDLNADKAKELRKDLMALYLSGLMDIDSFGRIREFRGDMPFVEFWQDNMESQVGFWGVVFTNKPVAVGSSWAQSLTLHKMGTVRMEGAGLPCEVTFARQADATVQGRKVGVVGISSPLKAKDLSGTLESGGQKSTLHITSLDRRAKGTVQFDVAKGQLISSNLAVDGDIDMAVPVKTPSGAAVSVSAKVKVKSTTVITLLPEGPGAAKPAGAGKGR